MTDLFINMNVFILKKIMLNCIAKTIGEVLVRRAGAPMGGTPQPPGPVTVQ